jgi:GntR family transcriptional regulator
MFREMTDLTGFVEDMRLLGRAATTGVISCDVVPAGHLVADKLAITTGTPAVQIRRVLLSAGAPLSFDETYLPEGLDRKVIADAPTTETICALLEERHDTLLIEAEYVLDAAAAEPAIAMAPEIPADSPIFLIDRTSYTLGDRPVDYERLYYRGDHIRFNTRMARRRAQRAPARG